MKKNYDFTWIEKRLKQAREMEQHGSYHAEHMSDREIVDSFTYPHNIFHWFDFEKSIMADNGGGSGSNNFAGDEENYFNQLNSYKRRYGYAKGDVESGLKDCINKHFKK